MYSFILLQTQCFYLIKELINIEHSFTLSESLKITAKIIFSLSCYCKINMIELKNMYKGYFEIINDSYLICLL